jgi:hypothetical protein
MTSSTEAVRNGVDTSVLFATLDELSTMFAEVQAARTFVNEAANRIVDRALTLSGGPATCVRTFCRALIAT